MSDASDSLSEEERSLFRPFTRESLAAIEARIAEEHAKQKELEKKRAEGEVRSIDTDEFFVRRERCNLPVRGDFERVASTAIVSKSLTCYVYITVGIQINWRFRSACTLMYFLHYHFTYKRLYPIGGQCVRE